MTGPTAVTTASAEYRARILHNGSADWRQLTLAANGRQGWCGVTQTGILVYASFYPLPGEVASMQRRTALLAVGGALATLAGCVSRGERSEDGGPDSDTNSGDPSSTLSENGDTPEWAPAAGDKTVVSQLDSAVDRPECTVESETIAVRGDQKRETAATIPYPDAMAYDSAAGYAEAFEEAYVTHDALCGYSGYVLSVTYAVEERETLAQFDGATGVYLRRYSGPGSGVAEEGGPVWAADMAPRAIVYAIDATGVARMMLGDSNSDELSERTVNAPDPRQNGTLVERFE